MIAQAILPFDAQEGGGPIKLDVTLTRGASIKGKVVDPTGKPVAAAEVVTGLSSLPRFGSWNGGATFTVRDGAFVLTGLDPDRSGEAYFLDAEHGLGATEVFSGQSAAAGPVTVRLLPCGSAKARFVDPEGHPVPIAADRMRAPDEFVYEFSLIVLPGPDRLSRTPEDREQLAAEGELLPFLDRLHYGEGPKADADGRVDFPCLIPGATYRVVDHSTWGPEGVHAEVRRDFTVKSGETLDLGDLVIRKPQVK